MRISRKSAPADFLQAFGARVQEKRQAAKIYQCDFASSLGISQSALSRIENGEIDISIRRAVRIACILNTTLPNLLEGLI